MPKRMQAISRQSSYQNWNSERWQAVVPLYLDAEQEEAVAQSIGKIVPDLNPELATDFPSRCKCGRRVRHRYCATCFKWAQETQPVNDPEEIRQILAKIKAELADKKKQRTVFISGGKQAAGRSPKPVRGP